MNTYYTTLEQSKKLVELGLDTKTADMCWTNHRYGPMRSSLTIAAKTISEYKNLLKRFADDSDSTVFYPAWSLGALLNAMPVYIIIDEVYSWNISPGYDGNELWIYYEDLNHETVLKITTGKNLIEAAINMIAWLLENDYIKKYETN